MAKRERVWTDGHITECNLCGDKFVEGQPMFDGTVIGKGQWHYLCSNCQKTRTIAGIQGKEESGFCLKYTYRPYKKEEVA